MEEVSCFSNVPVLMSMTGYFPFPARRVCAHTKIFSRIGSLGSFSSCRLDRMAALSSEAVFCRCSGSNRSATGQLLLSSNARRTSVRSSSPKNSGYIEERQKIRRRRDPSHQFDLRSPHNTTSSPREQQQSSRRGYGLHSPPHEVQALLEQILAHL